MAMTTGTKFKYGRDFVKTKIWTKLLKYETATQLAERIGNGTSTDDIYRWASRKHAPREVMKKLGVRTRVVTNKNNAPKAKTKANSGSGLFVSLVPSQHKKAFEAFNHSLGIDTKEFL